MGRLTGQIEYTKWQKGQKLTTKKAILAHCYMCNGLEDSANDCSGSKNCPIYLHSPYGRKRGLHRF